MSIQPLRSVLAGLCLVGCLTLICRARPRDHRPLAPGHWDSFNRARLEELIKTCGKGSPNFDATKPPYVVFDWDNTSMFLDMGDATFTYQLENLAFAITPEQFDQVLRKDIPSTNFVADYNNAAGQPVNIDKAARDILESYTWLYHSYRGLKGDGSLEEVRKSAHFLDFRAKMRYLYEAIGASFAESVSYPWVTYFFCGMTEQQVRKLGRDTLEWQLRQPVESVRWTSPPELPGRAGVVCVDWKNGVRELPEMQDLYRAFRTAGFQVWVCTASFKDIINEVSSNPRFGYDNPDDHVMGLELERDSQGVILPEYRHGHEQTHRHGKTWAIQHFLVSKYGYGPVFVAGDSEGDENMMQDFADTRLVLIVNLLRKADSDIGKFARLATETYGEPTAKYLLQGRDDNKGELVRSQLYFRLGGQTGELLRK